jgi:hypothetical protein
VSIKSQRHAIRGDSAAKFPPAAGVTPVLPNPNFDHFLN